MADQQTGAASGVAIAPYYQDDSVTIYHGDCFEVLHGLSGLGAIVTDPPYCSGGAFRGDRAASTVAKYVQKGTVAYRHEFGGDSRDQRSFIAWCSLWLSASRAACVPGAPIAAFIDWRQLPVMTDAVQAGGWTWRGIAVWAKDCGRPTPGRFTNQAEYVVWGSNGPMPQREEYPPGVFQAAIVRGQDRQHIAQKPEPVMNWVLRIVPEGSVVCDPFMGSGSTLRAAVDRRCRAIGIEADERYCEIAAKRMADRRLF